AAPRAARSRRRDLVAQRVAQQRRMPGTAAYLVANHRLDVGCAAAVDDVPDVLFGAESDHDAQAVTRRDVEERAGRHRVGNAHGVDAVRGHVGKVSLDGRDVVILVAARVGSESAIGHAAHVQLFRADEEELPSHARSRGGRRDGVCPWRARRGHRGGAGGTHARARVQRMRSGTTAEGACPTGWSAGRPGGWPAANEGGSVWYAMDVGEALVGQGYGVRGWPCVQPCTVSSEYV